MTNPRVEIERSMAQHKLAADSKQAEALRALIDFASAARRLNSLWEDDVAPLLDTGYPKGLPSFDELVEEIQAWRDKVKAVTR